MIELNRVGLGKECRERVTELEDGVEMVGERRGRAKRGEERESENSDEEAVQIRVESVQVVPHTLLVISRSLTSLMKPFHLESNSTL